MPKRVDHAQRRTEIAEALVRVAGRRGLHAVGMRDVAAEAGVSLRLVQYYFETKEKLLLFGLDHLTRSYAARVAAHLRAAPAPTPRTRIEALLLTALPTDDAGRTFHHLYTSYAILSVTDEALAAQPFITSPDAAEATVTDLLREAQHLAHLPADLNPHLEAVTLLAMSAGLGTSVLVGQRTPESAKAALEHHLNRLFGGGGEGEVEGGSREEGGSRGGSESEGKGEGGSLGGSGREE
ncbi:TetR/AcrR family transcriptional regulator [Streptomyces roseirectus]|uniref:TetR/AcrR family transcriptional regulator n=1 Tax=Streptomyces roseirectus TaxID=2768066 RepID=A0A7H0IH45_9ACTN|nr:TetR/AcrR family transcriptional regulator [Streptomyces roseirectus]QNP72111.1 TetR/AcrR family transcriptional regulator [Streptomyces roseirectus]